MKVFIPGVLENPDNARWHWARKMRWARYWRGYTAVLAGEAARNQGCAQWDPKAPKVVHFLAHVGRRFDLEDGLRPALKGVLDGLQPAKVIRSKKDPMRITVHPGAGIIHSDAEKSGHVFIYSQIVDKTNRGVEIQIEQVIMVGGTPCAG